MEKEQIKQQLKEQIIRYLNLSPLEPKDIQDDQALFGAGLGLDSIDSIELVVLLEREYGIKIENPQDGRKILIDINTMADYVAKNKKN